MSENRKRILFVALSESVHTARWISQILDQGWDIYLFPVSQTRINPTLKNIAYFNPGYPRFNKNMNQIKYINWTSPFFYLDYFKERFRRNSKLNLREVALSWAIKFVKPDLVHSLEIQHAAYLTYGVLSKLEKAPPWYVSNWGSDIFLFGRLAEEKARIQVILQSSDYYSCECKRDIQLALDLGFNGKIMPVLPNAGGIDIQTAIQFRQPGLSSERRIIILKGYQHWAGRALVGIHALKLCASSLENYEIIIYLASPEVKIAAELFSQDTGLKVRIIPNVAHNEMLRLFGKARVYLGLSISDGISTSLLEAMTMGVFPIQSCGACANEWFEDRIGGYIVDPDDPQDVANAIRLAISDDELVNRAAIINEDVIRKRLDQAVIRPQIRDIYRDILSSPR